MKEFFMSEFDKKTNELLERFTDDLIKDLEKISSSHPGNTAFLAVAAAGASMNFTKAMLRNYHAEMLEYLEKSNS